MKNQQMKRPNTIANKHNTGQKISANQQFDINGIKLNKDKDGNGPLLQQTHNGYPGNSNDRQVNQNNMSEIYDMLEKQQNTQNSNNGNNNQNQGKPNGGPPVISKENITFTNSKHIHGLSTTPQNN